MSAARCGVRGGGPPGYSRRERYRQEGIRHDGGQNLTLVGAVATGTVPAALFRQQEDTHGYLLSSDRSSRQGVPLALYSDRHGIFQRSPKEPELTPRSAEL